MIPTIAQLYESTKEGLDSASQLEGFGRQLLLSGKSPRLSREDWLRDHIAENLRAKGFAVEVERKRIDISMWDAGGQSPLITIEAKFLYTHGTSFFCNIWYDFLKRYHYRAPQYAIMFFGNYLEMPLNGNTSKLYSSSLIARLINKNEARLEIFQDAIDKKFKPLCTIHSDENYWSVGHVGALMSLHSVILHLEPTVSRDELVAKFKASTSRADFEKRINKLLL